MNIEDFHQEIQKLFPDFAETADAEFVRRFGKPDPEMIFHWFDDFAEGMNIKMRNGVKPKSFAKIFEYIKHKYLTENQEITHCIDVSIVENMFWKVSPEIAKPYWEMLPSVLKDLYVDFHLQSPT